MKTNHPDIMLYYSYATTEEFVHLHIVTCQSPDFPHGLELATKFGGPDRVENAEEFADKVQKYLDLIKNNN